MRLSELSRDISITLSLLIITKIFIRKLRIIMLISTQIYFFFCSKFIVSFIRTSPDIWLVIKKWNYFSYSVTKICIMTVHVSWHILQDTRYKVPFWRQQIPVDIPVRNISNAVWIVIHHQIRFETHISIVQIKIKSCLFWVCRSVRSKPKPQLKTQVLTILSCRIYNTPYSFWCIKIVLHLNQKWWRKIPVRRNVFY
jgi:hypothetical protein